MITGNSLQSHVQGWIFGVFTVPAGPPMAIQGTPSNFRPTGLPRALVLL